LIQFDRFKDGKKQILTMSYDDGHETDRKLVEIFNKFGIKGPFSLIPVLWKNRVTINKSELAELYDKHEVAVHTVSHPHLERLPLQNICTREVIQDRQNLEQLCAILCGECHFLTAPIMMTF